MTTLAASSGAAGEPAEDSVRPVPTRADGVRLLGEQRGSGYRVAPALVQRSDGQILQLTPLLYAVLAAVDGARTVDDIAAHVSSAVHRDVRGADIETLIAKQLRPLGVLTRPDGSQPEVRKANPLLALRFRYVVSNPRAHPSDHRAVRRSVQPACRPAHLRRVPVIAYWVLFDKGLASAAHEAFTDPGMLLAVFAITVVSAGFHEFGHAAALRRGGGTPGAMGAGLYLVWPAFYTDVTNSYRLGRRARLRTDLGGLYFNALLALAMFAMWAALRWDGLLLVIATQLLQMLRQLPPMLRFDGYHLLADLTGVPDLFHRIKPTMKGLLPTHWRSPEARVLKPWARAVVSLWVLVVVPLMLLTALVTILTLPRILASAANSFRTQWTLLAGFWHHGDWTGVGAKVLALIAVIIPVLGVSYLVTRMVRQLVGSALRRTQGRPVRRAGVMALGAAMVAALVWVWWPHGNYRVIQPGERGVLQQAFAPAALSRAIEHAPPQPLTGAAVTAAVPASNTRQALREGDRTTARTVWPADTPRPTANQPTLAMVLTPRDPGKPTWVFPFNRPAPPGPGDNQALAVATEDGSAAYDVAFALVYADHDTVLNKNEAYAFASCKNCVAVAVAFQVVLIVGDAHVIAPQNISAAVGYNCIRCVTAALAIQLDVSLPARSERVRHGPARCLVGQDPCVRQAREGLDVQPNPRPDPRLREADPRHRDALRRHDGFADVRRIGIGKRGRAERLRIGHRHRTRPHTTSTATSGSPSGSASGSAAQPGATASGSTAASATTTQPSATGTGSGSAAQVGGAAASTTAPSPAGSTAP